MISESLLRTLPIQMEEVEREIRMRCDVYPRLVSTRKMRQGEADEHLRRMRMVLDTLKELKRETQ